MVRPELQACSCADTAPDARATIAPAARRAIRPSYVIFRTSHLHVDAYRRLQSSARERRNCCGRDKAICGHAEFRDILDRRIFAFVDPDALHPRVERDGGTRRVLCQKARRPSLLAGHELERGRVITVVVSYQHAADGTDAERPDRKQVLQAKTKDV